MVAWFDSPEYQTLFKFLPRDAVSTIKSFGKDIPFEKLEQGFAQADPTGYEKYESLILSPDQVATSEAKAIYDRGIDKGSIYGNDSGFSVQESATLKQTIQSGTTYGFNKYTRQGGSGQGDIFVTITTQGRCKSFARSLTALRGINSEGLETVYRKIAEDFFSTNEDLLFNKTPESLGWEPHSQHTERRKLNKEHPYKSAPWEVGSTPIMLFGPSGSLRKALTNIGSPDAVVEIDRHKLRLGVNHEWASAIEKGTKFNPYPRPFIRMDIGDRVNRWESIVNSAIQEVQREAMKV